MTSLEDSNKKETGIDEPSDPDIKQHNISISNLPVREQGLNRYEKWNDRLGSGAYKDVWRAFDHKEGIEVAWNVVKLDKIPKGERKRIKTEVKLLKDLAHKNVIKYYSSWVDRDNEQIIFITEIMSHGSLKDYLKKNPMIRWNAVKRWCRQILDGLQYLHSNNIIHRDIKCDNIFINGATGDVRIGDLGLSTRIAEDTSLGMTCLGTPEFMAPELYDEKYTSKVDIYAFGMTIVEMVTGHLPYHECTSTAQIYKKVSSGKYPPELDHVFELNYICGEFVFSCLQSADRRPTAENLQSSSFLTSDEKDFELVRVSIAELPDDHTYEKFVEFGIDDDVLKDFQNGDVTDRAQNFENGKNEEIAWGKSRINSFKHVSNVEMDLRSDLELTDGLVLSAENVPSETSALIDEVHGINGGMSGYFLAGVIKDSHDAMYSESETSVGSRVPSSSFGHSIGRLNATTLQTQTKPELIASANTEKDGADCYSSTVQQSSPTPLLVRQFGSADGKRVLRVTGAELPISDHQHVRSSPNLVGSGSKLGIEQMTVQTPSHTARNEDCEDVEAGNISVVVTDHPQIATAVFFSLVLHGEEGHEIEFYFDLKEDDVDAVADEMMNDEKTKDFIDKATTVREISPYVEAGKSLLKSSAISSMQSLAATISSLVLERRTMVGREKEVKTEMVALQQLQFDEQNSNVDPQRGIEKDNDGEIEVERPSDSKLDQSGHMGDSLTSLAVAEQHLSSSFCNLSVVERIQPLQPLQPCEQQSSELLKEMPPSLNGASISSSSVPQIVGLGSFDDHDDDRCLKQGDFSALSPRTDAVNRGGWQNDPGYKELIEGKRKTLAKVEKDNQKIVNFLKDDRDKVDDWYKKKRKELVAKRDDLFVQLAKMKDSLKLREQEILVKMFKLWSEIDDDIHRNEIWTTSSLSTLDSSRIDELKFLIEHSPPLDPSTKLVTTNQESFGSDDKGDSQRNGDESGWLSSPLFS